MMNNSYDVMKATMDTTNPERLAAAIDYTLAWQEWEDNQGSEIAYVYWREVEIAQERFFGLDWS